MTDQDSTPVSPSVSPASSPTDSANTNNIAEEPQTERLFTNATQVRDYVNAMGYRTTHYRVNRAMERNELIVRRGGGWTVRTVEAWARQWLARRADPSPEKDAPAMPHPETASGSISEEKALAQTMNFKLDAERKRFEFDRERGRYTLTETMEAELGARARAFRLSLERFGVEQSEHVAALFGGSNRTAQELTRRLGLDGEAAATAQVIVQDYVLSRASAFATRWQESIEDFLDAYATGNWWTDTMREAWERYEEHAHDNTPPSA